MGGLRPRLLLYLFKSAKGQASEHVFCILFFSFCQQKTVEIGQFGCQLQAESVLTYLFSRLRYFHLGFLQIDSFSTVLQTVYNASWCSLTHSVSGILRGGLKSRCSDCAGGEVGIGKYS